MSASTIETRNRVVGQYKDQVKSDHTVFYTGLAILIASLGIGIALGAMMVAFSADQEASVTSIWVRDFHADMKAHGYKVPPLPEEIQ